MCQEQTPFLYLDITHSEKVISNHFHFAMASTHAVYSPTLASGHQTRKVTACQQAHGLVELPTSSHNICCFSSVRCLPVSNCKEHSATLGPLPQHECTSLKNRRKRFYLSLSAILFLLLSADYLAIWNGQSDVEARKLLHGLFGLELLHEDLALGVGSKEEVEIDRLGHTVGKFSQPEAALLVEVDVDGRQVDKDVGTRN